MPPIRIQSATRRSVQENNIELKSITLQPMQNIQIIRLPSEDLNTYISNFLEVCDTMKYNEVPNETIRLCLFSFSLRDRAKDSITT